MGIPQLQRGGGGGRGREEAMVRGRGGEGGFGRREGEWGMKLPEGEAWLVFTGCGADRLRSVCMHAVSHGIDGLCS